MSYIKPGIPVSEVSAMSHVTDVKLHVTDEDALEEACQLLGLKLNKGQSTYRWYGRWVNDFSGAKAAVTLGHDPKTFGKGADHTISVMGVDSAYEIGVVKSKQGEGYDLLFDAWGAGGHKLQAVAGKDLSLLRQEYAVAVATKAVRRKLGRKGFKVKRENLANGMVRLHVSDGKTRGR